MIIQYINNWQQQSQEMNQYEQNLIYLDVFDYLSLDIHQNSNYQSFQFSDNHQHFPSNNSQNQDNKQTPTSPDSELTQLSLPIVPEQSSKIGRLQLVFNEESLLQRSKVSQGIKDDTVELNINFKTILFNHFKELALLKELEPEQSKLVFEFGERSPSFKSLLLFCGEGENRTRIRSQSLKLVESSIFIRRIIQSRCKMTTKLQMIKFVEVFRANILTGKRIIRWKDGTRK